MKPVNIHPIVRDRSLIVEKVNREEEPPFVLIERHFPRIADAIHLMWGNRELDDYLQKMIVADRTDRGGFPEEVLGALLKLYNQHAEQFQFQKPEDVWAKGDRLDRVKRGSLMSLPERRKDLVH